MGTGGCEYRSYLEWQLRLSHLVLTYLFIFCFITDVWIILDFLFCSGSGRKSKNSSSFLDESSFFDEERLRDEHLRIAQKIHAAGNGRTENGPSFQDYAETCSEVNLSSRTSKNGKKIICNGAKFFKELHLKRIWKSPRTLWFRESHLGVSRSRNPKLCVLE